MTQAVSVLRFHLARMDGRASKRTHCNYASQRFMMTVVRQSRAVRRVTLPKRVNKSRRGMGIWRCCRWLTCSFSLASRSSRSLRA